MEYFTAKKLREEWGSKPCDHPKVEKEYYADTHTLDYVCRQCGTEFNVLEMLELRDNQKKREKEIA
jgi:DNA-directed RNA polymerase subunit RPC12/RpoP